MKKSNLFILIFMIVSIVYADAPGLKKVFDAKEITFYGLDFTKTAFVGNFGAINDLETSPKKLRDKYILGWNNILVTERPKYNAQRFYNKDTVYTDINVTKERNSKIDTADIYKLSNQNFVTPHLKSDDLKQIVKELNIEAKTSVGLVYIVDFFNKDVKQGCIWAVFFDTKTKEILYEASFTESAAGIGLRNFWASVVLRTMEKSSAAYKKETKKMK